MCALTRLFEERLHDRFAYGLSAEPFLVMVWRSNFQTFVFADFVDPRVVRPSRNVVDIIIRMFAVLPAVVHLPLELQKESIARALVQRFQTPSIDLKFWLSQTRRDILGFVVALLNTWGNMKRTMFVAAPVITSFVGQENIAVFGGHHSSCPYACSPTHTATTVSTFVWKGFDHVFQGQDFWEEFVRFRDPKRLLPPIIERAEMVTNRTWPQLCSAVAARRIDPSLASLLPTFAQVGEHDKLFTLLWRSFQILLDFKQTFDLCCDWLSGGIERRLGMLSERFSQMFQQGQYIVTVRKPEGTQRLLMLFVTGVFSRLKKNRMKKNFRSEQEFVDALFRKRILLTATTALIPPAVATAFEEGGDESDEDFLLHRHEYPQYMVLTWQHQPFPNPPATVITPG
jgi:hypothetical protein